MTENQTSPDSPAATTSAVPLHEVLCIHELDQRPLRPPDHERENRALATLALALAGSPKTVLQTLAETILEVCQVGSAGVSLLTEDETRFCWPAIAGLWKPHIGEGTPRDFGPCGDVLDRNMPLLFKNIERRYSYLPPAEECLLVPFYVAGKVVGAIWAIAHDGCRKFDSEDRRMLVSLGVFASAAYQALEQIKRLRQQTAEREKGEQLLRDVNEALLLGSLRQHELTEIADASNVQLQNEITERKRVEAALRESEERYRNLFNSIDEGFCVIEVIFDEHQKPVDYRFLEVNPSFVKQSGIVNATGKRMLELVPSIEAHWLETYGRVAISGIPVRMAREFKTLENRWFDVYAFRIGEPDSHHVAVIFNNITEQKRSQEALRLSDEWQRLLFESVKDFAIFSVDESGCITDWNPGAARMFGYESSEVLLQNYSLIFTPDDRQGGIPEQEIRTALSEGFATDERWHLRKNGERFFSSGTIRPLHDEAGKPFGFIIVARDVTERHRAAEYLAEEDRRKNEFMAMLAHELRNPLAPIKSATEVLRMTKTSDSSMLKVQEILERQVNHMVRLVDDLLDTSRIQHRKVTLHLTHLDLSSVILGVLDAVSDLVKLSGHSISVELEHAIPLYVEADPARVAQIISNLFVNAVKYTPPNGAIHVSTSRENGMAVVRIRDNGIGIEPHMLGAIFGLFTQVEVSLERSRGGLGLGLKLVKELVELQGGTVEAKSEGIGKGSEFIVRLPEVINVTPASQANQQIVSGPSRRILLIDDNVDVLESMNMLLTMTGHSVELAQTGKQAVEKALSGNFDVALVDIGLPEMNGYEVARTIRQNPRTKGMTLVALTGYGQEKDKRRALEAGFHDHLTKPVDAWVLTGLLNGLEKYHE